MPKIERNNTIKSNTNNEMMKQINNAIWGKVQKQLGNQNRRFENLINLETKRVSKTSPERTPALPGV